MNRLLHLPLLVILLGMAGLSMLVPAGHAFVMRDHGLARSFLYAALLIVTLAGMLALALANRASSQQARSYLMALVLSYLILPPVLALPLVQAPAGGAGFGAAWFEMLSCFTTTGAPVLDGATLKPTVHLWRAQVGWMGGLFALVMAFAVLAPLNLGGVEVGSGRRPGNSLQSYSQITRVADPAQRMARFAARIFPIYGGLTLVLWIGLIMLGEDSFIALCHALSTFSSSGISPIGGLHVIQSGWMAEALILICFLFAITRRPMQRALGQTRDGRFWQDPELRLALLIISVAVVGLWLWHWHSALGAGRGTDFARAIAAFWGVLFTCISFLTTTGFVSDNWAAANEWSGLHAPDTVLWALAIVGGGVATTAGGVKLLRVNALLLFGQQELERVVHPNVVSHMVRSPTISREATVQGIAIAWVFFMTFGLAILAFVAALTLVQIPFDSALVLTLSALTTNGPLADHAGGIAADFARVNGAAQVILGAAMVVGRLETFAILALLLPEQHRT